MSDAEINEALSGRERWTAEGNALVRAVEFANFPQAIQAVDRIALIAEEVNHHPDIDIRWRTVKFSLSTHVKGGITANDVALADRIDAVVTELTGT